MNKCSPIGMRNNLIIVDALEKSGIDFVAVPVLNKDDKEELLSKASERLEIIKQKAIREE